MTLNQSSALKMAIVNIYSPYKDLEWLYHGIHSLIRYFFNGKYQIFSFDEEIVLTVSSNEALGITIKDNTGERILEKDNPYLDTYLEEIVNQILFEIQWK